jgi:hypothetical protein
MRFDVIVTSSQPCSPASLRTSTGRVFTGRSFRLTVTYSHSDIGTHAQKTKAATQCTLEIRRGNSAEPSVSDRGVNFRLHCRKHLAEPQEERERTGSWPAEGGGVKPENVDANERIMD